MTPRLLKQIAYILLYLVIFSLVGAGIYRFLIYKQTCFDSKKNQGESAVDCGGPCAPCAITDALPIQVAWKKFLPATAKFSDLVIKLQNPNAKYGASNFAYKAEFYNETGVLIKEIKGESFIMPLQVKYIVSPYVDILAKDIADIKFGLEKIEWKKIEEDVFSLLATRDIRAHFSFGPELGYIIVEGKVINKSSFTLNEAPIIALIFSKKEPQEVLAAGATKVYTLTPGEERYFQITIKERIPGAKNEDIDLESVNVLAETNFFLYYQ